MDFYISGFLNMSKSTLPTQSGVFISKHEGNRDEFANVNKHVSGIHLSKYHRNEHLTSSPPGAALISLTTRRVTPNDHSHTPAHTTSPPSVITSVPDHINNVEGVIFDKLPLLLRNDDFLSGMYDNFYAEDPCSNRQCNSTYLLFAETARCSNSTVVLASRHAYLYGIAAAVLFAVLFNTVMLIALRTEKARRTPCAIYLTALAVSDTLSLVTHLPRKWLQQVFEQFGGGHFKLLFLYNNNTILCKGITYLTYLFRFLSSWYLVAMVTDRLYVALFPLQPAKHQTLKSARHIVAYITVFGLLVNCHILVTWKSVKIEHMHTISCVSATKSTIVSFSLITTTVILIVGLPLLVLSCLNLILMRNLSRANWRPRSRMVNSNLICKSVIERKASLMTLVISCCFAVLCIPYAISWTALLVEHVIVEISICQYMERIALKDLTEAIHMLNYCIKFIIVVFTGKNVIFGK